MMEPERGVAVVPVRLNDDGLEARVQRCHRSGRFQMERRVSEVEAEVASLEETKRGFWLSGSGSRQSTALRAWRRRRLLTSFVTAPMDIERV
jgi:hypothetical protein